MSAHQHQARGTTWKAIRNTLLVLGLGIGVLPLLMGTALAQHAEVTASIDCADRVTFTATAWDGEGEAGTQAWIDSRTNTDIRVWYTVDSADPADPSATVVGDGAFTLANDFRFDGAFDAPATGVIRVFAQAQASWADGADPGDVRSTGPLARPSCPADPGPTATADGTGLEIFKSAPAQVDELSTITFTLVVRNGGEGVAHDVGAIDNLWDRLTDVAGTYDGPGGDDGTCILNPGNNHVKCEVIQLAPGQTMTVTITATTPDLPLRDGGRCEVGFDNIAWTVSNETGYEAPVYSNTVHVTVTGTGCEQSPSPSPTTVSPTSPPPSPTVSPSTFTPTSTTTSTKPPTVQPTAVASTPPGGIAFTGAAGVVPMGAIALALLTAGTGLMWIGRRRRDVTPPS